MLIVCHSEDKRAAVRHRLFNYWFDKEKFSESIIKIDHTEQLPDYDLYSSILIHKQNTNREEIKNKYRKQSE